MNKITTTKLMYLLRSHNLRTLFYLFAGLSILAASTPLLAEEAAEDFTLLSFEDLLEVKVVRNSVNVLHSHIHQKNQWMVGYRYMLMEMDGNQNGSSSVSTASVLRDFPVAPLSMRMESHMFNLMYAPTDDVTLMAMLPYKTISMKHITRTGRKFTTRAEGIGDLNLMGHYVIVRAPQNKYLLSLQAGMSIPTGSIDKKDRTPAGPRQKLPYPMQLGSGTYDLKIGGNFQYFNNAWLFGINSTGTIRLGKNDNDYRLGNVFEIGSWATYAWNDWVSTSAHLKGTAWGNISGADPDLNPLIVPTADTNLRGGNRVDMLFNIELYVPNGKWKGNSFGLELGVPVHQNLDGPQLKRDWTLSAGWQWVF